MSPQSSPFVTMVTVLYVNWFVVTQRSLGCFWQFEGIILNLTADLVWTRLRYSWKLASYSTNFCWSCHSFPPNLYYKTMPLSGWGNICSGRWLLCYIILMTAFSFEIYSPSVFLCTVDRKMGKQIIHIWSLNRTSTVHGNIVNIILLCPFETGELWENFNRENTIFK